MAFLAKIKDGDNFGYRLVEGGLRAANLIEKGYDVYLIKDPATAGAKPTLRKVLAQTVSKSVSVTELMDGEEVVASTTQ
jgi:hypothetical protein